MYDVCSKESFRNITAWLKNAYNLVEKEKVSFILIGNKIDKTEFREVST